MVRSFECLKFAISPTIPFCPVKTGFEHPTVVIVPKVLLSAANNSELPSAASRGSQKVDPETTLIKNSPVSPIALGFVIPLILIANSKEVTPTLVKPPNKTEGLPPILEGLIFKVAVLTLAPFPTILQVSSGNVVYSDGNSIKM